MLTNEAIDRCIKLLQVMAMEHELGSEEWDMYADQIQALQKVRRRPVSRLPEGYAVVSACSFEVEGRPGVKMRARIGRWGKMMNPAENRIVEERIRNQVIEQIPERLKAMLPWHGPVVLNAHFRWCPAKLRSRAVHIVRPDLDNALKSVCDSLNDILWEDDSQVFDVHVTKAYDPGGAKTLLKVFFLEKSNGIP